MRTFAEQAKNLRYLATKGNHDDDNIAVPRSTLIEAAEAIELLEDLRHALKKIPAWLIKKDGL